MPAAPGNKYSQKYTEQDIEDLANELIEHCTNEQTVVLATFSIKHRKTKSWLYQMAEDYPRIQEALNAAREILAAKLVNLPFFNKGNAYVGMQYLPVYDKEYREWLKEKAEMNKMQPQLAENKCSFNEWAEEQKNKE